MEVSITTVGPLGTNHCGRGGLGRIGKIFAGAGVDCWRRCVERRCSQNRQQSEQKG